MHLFSDEQLIEIYLKNMNSQGKKALDYLYIRYEKAMLNYFYFALQNDYDKAQDFVQDLFIKIIDNIQKFDTNQKFQSWIYRIASNMCKNEYKSNKVFLKYKKYVSFTSGQYTTNNENENALKMCINALEPEHRSLIVLRFKMKLSIKEIAEIYDCPEGTVKSRLFYATKQLSKNYKR